MISIIQHFEADFLWKVSLKILNSGLILILLLYILVNNLSVTSGGVFLGWTSTKLGLMCLAQGHNAVTPVRL